MTINKEDLIAYLASGCKAREDWRIGTEHEKFAFDLKTLKPLPYESRSASSSVRGLLEGLAEYGWDPVFENGVPVALKMSDQSSITLEPGGQIELSGAPLQNVHQTCREVTGHINQVKEVAEKIGAGLVGLGYQPKWELKHTHWKPKGRYEIMRNYMPLRGELGHHMMLATCTVQVNLDFSSESHMVEMYRTALKLQPIATALWANSPFKDGQKNGFLSYRSHIWTDTDPDRCGMMPCVFHDDFGFESYVDYMLDLPMYFVHRDGKYIDTSGQSFREYMDGKLPAMPGEKPTIKDWEDHLTTAFPEVRLKKFMEMRGADGGSSRNLCALPAFWVGLLYDEESFANAVSFVADWSFDEIKELRSIVPFKGLKTPFRDSNLQEVAKDILKISERGLINRALYDGSGNSEAIFLRPLDKIADSGITPAEEMLVKFDADWGSSVDPIFKDYAY